MGVTMSNYVAVSALALVYTLLSPAIAHAQDQTQGDAVVDDADAIVVVGRLTDSMVDREHLDRIQANDLADIFRSTPSVSVGGSLGIAQKIYVRGLEDSQLNVTDRPPLSGPG